MKLLSSIVEGKDVVNKEYVDAVEISQNGMRTILTAPDGTQTVSYGNIFYGELTGTATEQTATIQGITTYYEGLTVSLKFNVATQRKATVNINGLGAVPLRWGASAAGDTSTNTNYYPANYTLMFVYCASDSTFRAIWSYDSNTNDQLRASYDRRYAGAEGMPAYKIFGVDILGKARPLTTTAGTGTSKVVQTAALDPTRFYFYNHSTAIAANAVLNVSYVMLAASTSGATYTFNSTLAVYRDVYLKGNLGADGMFTLDNSSLTSWYVQVPKNGTTINLSSYFATGYQYIYLGSSYSTANYFWLYPAHPMFEFDGTNLLPYAQSIATKKLDKTGDGKDVTVTFSDATTRANISSAEKLSVMFGKIKKWFAEMGTAAFKNVPASGNAATGEVVLGSDTRLTNARTPTSHNHTKSQITDFPTTMPPSAHKSTHVTGGGDALTPADIGAAEKAVVLTGTLTVAGWAGSAKPFTQNLSISGLATSGYTYTVAPAPGSLDAYVAAGIRMADVTTANVGAFTAAYAKPSVALTVYIIKQQIS